MNYQEWESALPEMIKADPLWKLTVYRSALFIGDLSWYDVTKLMQDRRTLKLSDQLYRAVGSISANISEGYSRGTGKDRARFYEYALGSAREGRDWYFKSRFILENDVFLHRSEILTTIMRLLLTMIPRQRQSTIREEYALYGVKPRFSEEIVWEDIQPLLQHVPMPT
jgi:four helix bundle protein